MIIVTLIEDNIIVDITTFYDTDRNKAESLFFDLCETSFSNFDEYTEKDRDAILTQGYERGGNKGICISTID